MSGYAQQAELGQAEAGAFDRSRGLFEEVVAGLAAPGCGELTHAQLEDQLTERCRELMRSLFQDHLDLRAAREQRLPGGAVGAEGVVRARAERGHHRELTTVFGTVTVTRIAYRAPGVANLYPADAVLNLSVGKHSHGLRRLAAIEAARGSFEQAIAAVERSSGVRVGKRQLETLTLAASADVADFYAQREPRACPDTDLLVLTVDGKGIVMRPEALREATARAARTAGHKLATRLSPGEKHGRKRMAELAGVYDATPTPRAPGDVISRPGGPRTPTPGPHARGTWLTASITEDIPTVITTAFDEAHRRDPEQRRSWVALVGLHFQRWLRDILAGIDRPEHRQIVERFAAWHVQRRLHRFADQGPVTAKQTQQARAEIRLAIAFLAWLGDHGRGLGSCGQADVDAWYAGAYTARRLTHAFLRWSMRNQLLTQMTIPHQNTTNPTPISQNNG